MVNKVLTMVMYGYMMSITIHNHFCCTICFEEKRMKNPKDRIREIENRLEQLPKGTLTYKTSMERSSHMCRAVLTELMIFVVKNKKSVQICIPKP